MSANNTRIEIGPIGYGCGCAVEFHILTCADIQTCSAGRHPHVPPSRCLESALEASPRPDGNLTSYEPTPTPDIIAIQHAPDHPLAAVSTVIDGLMPLRVPEITSTITDDITPIPNPSTQPPKQDPRNPRAQEGTGSHRLPQTPATGPHAVNTLSGTKAKRGKHKDPNTPKRPPSAYLIYQNEIRQRVRNQFPEHTPQEISKEIGNMWQTLPPERRQEYQDRFQDAYQQWFLDRVAYEQHALVDKKRPPPESRTKEGPVLKRLRVDPNPDDEAGPAC